MFIHRPDKNATEKELAEGKIKKNVAEIIVEKHRNGPQGLVELFFKGECTKFVNLNESGEPEGTKEETSAPQRAGVAEAEDLPFENAPDDSPLPEEPPTTVDDELFE